MEHRTLDVFRRALAANGLAAGEVVCVLSESPSRATLVETARRAAEDRGGRVVDVRLPTPPNPGPVAIRSTGSSVALQGNPAALAALCACDLVVDCTVEGLLHAPELPAVLGAGTRVLMISNEHPEAFERWAPDDGALQTAVLAGLDRLRAAREMHVTSAAGTDLRVDLAGAFTAGSWGATDGPGTIAHWPGGLVVAFPAAGTVEGTVVLAPGDVNLTFKEYVREPVRLEVAGDRVVRIEGDGVDAELLRSYLAAFGEEEAYGVSHVGWGMNPGARWDALAMVDKRETNGIELRAFAGNFLFSTGANENAGRFTRGHFDFPLRGCTVTLDGRTVVDAGRLAGG
ncbi:MAG: peptidase M29 [Gaiellales bacterium]